jgi:NAD(P)-dependent dehydrogenase (short-subunit alcohol dehydrogenase family)
MKSLEGKVAIVTGSAAGIGKVTARVLAEQGAAVVLADIREELVTQAAEELTSQGFAAAAVGVDVTSEDDVRRMVDTAVATFGRLDVLHNNAALVTPDVIAQDGWIADLDPELFDRVLRVNVIGPTLGAKHAIPHMIRGGGGVVITTASIAGSLGQLLMPMYGMSKAALLGLTRSIATQYGRDGVRAVGISPGFILTETSQTIPPEFLDLMVRHTLVPRAGIPDDIATMVAFLASDQAGYITGITIDIDGGFSVHYPTWADEVHGPHVAAAGSPN